MSREEEITCLTILDNIGQHTIKGAGFGHQLGFGKMYKFGGYIRIKLHTSNMLVLTLSSILSTQFVEPCFSLL